MKKELKVLKFIRENENWEKILSVAPYFITVSRDKCFGKNLVMLKYSQIESDFTNEIVRECRGLIFDEDTLEPICVPFFKFGNYGESYCPEIDWKNCWVGEKLDGSLIKVSFVDDDILISTNGTIDAFKAPIVEQIGCEAKNFGELVMCAIKNAYKENFKEDFVHPIELDNWFYYLFEKGKTYMFELTSPFNKVIVAWHETRLNFLGMRDNETLEEKYFTDCDIKKYFKTPKVFPLRNIDECVKAAEALDVNNEGYVVCDRNFNRVKVKSPTYVSLHHMKNNGILSYERGVEIVRTNELGEILTYFPEFKEHLEKIKSDYDRLVSDLDISWTAYKTADRMLGFKTRKDSALWIVKNFRIPAVGFSLIDNKVETPKKWLETVPAKNLVKILGYKE